MYLLSIARLSNLLRRMTEPRYFVLIGIFFAFIRHTVSFPDVVYETDSCQSDFSCQCGKTGQRFIVTIQRVTYSNGTRITNGIFHSREIEMQFITSIDGEPNCQDYLDNKQVVCSKFRHCLSCKNGGDRCMQCPRGTSGPWCTDNEYADTGISAVRRTCSNEMICGKNAICQETSDGYTCECKPGFQKVNPTPTSECRDIDECSNHRTQSFPTNDYCPCPAGFKGNTLEGCTDIDECDIAPNMCGKYATCRNNVGSYSCECNAGFIRIEPFITSGCKDVDECELEIALCSPSAVCINSVGSYSCSCPNGFIGDPFKSCEVADDCTGYEKRLQNCAETAKCVKQGRNVYCECPPGFTGNSKSKCYDINECEDNKCGTNATCRNINGGYFCVCPEGFVGNPTDFCTDVNECQFGEVCGQFATCYNTPGSYHCQCQSGYEKAGSLSTSGCQIPNRCKEVKQDNWSEKQPCSSGQSCYNTVGSYYCECHTSECKELDAQSKQATICQIPLAPKFGKIISSGHTVGNIIQYICDDSYILVGEKTRTCLQNGNWSGSSPFCQLHITSSEMKQCILPQPPKNGKVTINNDKLTEGTMVYYVCDDYYTLIGSNRRKCEANGAWSGTAPTCEQHSHTQGHKIKSCPPLSDPKNGKITVNNYEIGEGTIARYVCNTDFSLIGESTRRCQSSGKWTGREPICQPLYNQSQASDDICTSPPVVVNSNRTIYGVFKEPVQRTHTSTGSLIRHTRHHSEVIELATKHHYPPGTMVYYTCTEFYELRGTQSLHCMADGTWSGRPPVCVPKCGRSSEIKLPTIINGIESRPGAWPWQTQLMRWNVPNNKWDFICGGSLLNEWWVVTAAHCISSLYKYQINIGRHYITENDADRDSQSRGIGKILIHENYDPSILDSDIALLMLDRDVTLTQYVQPVCLPNKFMQQQLFNGNTGVVTGWGRTETNKTSEKLLQAKMSVLDTNRCVENYKQHGRYTSITITDNMFCAGVEGGISDVCSGDSGSPMVFKDKTTNAWYLEGIVSWGSLNGCAVRDEYSGFTKVRNFITWIKQHTGAL